MIQGGDTPYFTSPRHTFFSGQRWLERGEDGVPVKLLVTARVHIQNTQPGPHNFFYLKVWREKQNRAGEAASGSGGPAGSSKVPL